MILSEPLVTGTVLKIWNHNRGHDYMVAGFNRGDKTLSLIKNNCINNDGKIHASTQKFSQRTGSFHKEILVEELFDGASTAPRVTRVMGTRDFDKAHLSQYVREVVGSRTLVALKADHAVYPPIECTDARSATVFA